MKKTNLLMMLLVMCCTLAFAVSCGGGEGKDPGGSTPPSSDAIISYENKTTIVYDDSVFGMNSEELEDIYSAIIDMGGLPGLSSEADEVAAHEIVLGDTSRDISKEAQRKLANSMKRYVRYSTDEDAASEDVAGYAIYSNGSSVAIVWSDERIMNLAVDFFLDNYIGGNSLTLEEGYVRSEVFSMSAYLYERGEKIKSEAWEEFVAAFPDRYAAYSGEITASIKNLYSLYSSDVFLFFANLYDPDTGGWYTSPSARDNLGYAPAIEETWYGLGVFAFCGAGEMYGDERTGDVVWTRSAPEWIRQGVVNFFYSLYDHTDGNFYHPQWPKEYLIEGGYISRASRDTNSATSVLKMLNAWPVPKGTSYEISPSDAPLATGFGTSSVSAVSKVVAVNSLYDHYETAEAFAEYLEGLEASLVGLDDNNYAYKFYSWGNTFQADVGRINANPEVRSMLIEFLDSHQNPENGMWSKNLYYNSTNAAHKIGDVYNRIGAEIKYVDKMVESTIKVLLFDPEDQPAQYIVEPYNAWSVFPYLYTNIRKYGAGDEAARAEKCAEIKEIVFSNATVMIDNAYRNLLDFAYEDGSFGYYPTSVGAGGTSQGCPSCVPGSKEGSVDATLIAIDSLTNCIFGALELSDVRVPIYTEYERDIYERTIESLGPVIKGAEIVNEPFVIDFEDGATPDDIPVELSITKRQSEISVKEDEKGDRYLYVVTKNWYGREGNQTTKRNANIDTPFNVVAENSNAAVVEASLMFESINSSRSAHFDFLSKDSSVIASIHFCGRSIGGRYYVYIQDSAGSDIYSSADGKKTAVCFPTRTEVKVRLEYYKEYGAIRVYLDGAYVGESKVIKKPNTDAQRIRFNFQGDIETNLRIDDYVAERDRITYAAKDHETVPEYPLPVLGRQEYTFNNEAGKDYPLDLMVDEKDGEVSIKTHISGNALKLVGTDRYYYDSTTPGTMNWDTTKANPVVGIHTYPAVENGNAYKFGADIDFEEASILSSKRALTLMNIRFLDSQSREAFGFSLYLETEGNKSYAVLISNTLKSTPLAKIEVGGEFVRVEMIYFPETGRILFTNGEQTYAIASGTKLPISQMEMQLATGASSVVYVDNLSLILTSESDNPSIETIKDPTSNLVNDYTTLPEFDSDFKDQFTETFDRWDTASNADLTLPDGVTMNQTPSKLKDNAYGVAADEDGEGKHLFIDSDNYYAPGADSAMRNPMFTFKQKNTESAEYAVVSFDLSLVSAASNGYKNLIVILVNSQGTKIVDLNFVGQSNGKMSASVYNGSQVIANLSKMSIGAGETITVTVLYEAETGRAYFYVGDELVGKCATGLKGERISKVKIESTTGSNADVIIDDLILVNTYLEFPQIEGTEPEPETPNTPSTPGESTSGMLDFDSLDEGVINGNTSIYIGKLLATDNGAAESRLAIVEDAKNGGRLLLNKGGAGLRFFNKAEAPADANVTVFEADFAVNVSYMTNALQIDWRSAADDSNTSLRKYLSMGTRADADAAVGHPTKYDYVILRETNSTAVAGWPYPVNGSDAHIEMGEQFHLRLEYYWSVTDGDTNTGKIKIYLNGSYVTTVNAPANPEGMGDIRLYISRKLDANENSLNFFTIDNVVYGDFKITYTEEAPAIPDTPDEPDEPETPIEPADPSVEDFSGEYTEKVVSDTITNISFPSGISAAHPSGDKTNGGKSAVTVEEGTDGNKYLKITAEKRAASSDRSHTISVNAQNLLTSGEAKSYVLEFDINLETFATTFSMFWWSKDYIQLDCTTKDGYICFAGAPIMPVNGEWCSVRMEYYPAEKCILVYNDGVYLSTINTASGGSFDSLGASALKTASFAPNNSNAGYTFYLDNVCCYYSNVAYSVPGSSDEPENDSELPAGVEIFTEADSETISAGASLSVKELDDGKKAVSIVAKNTGGTNYSVALNASSTDGALFDGEVDIKFSSVVAPSTDTVLVNVRFYNGDYCARTLGIQVKADGTVGFQDNIRGGYYAFPVDEFVTFSFQSYIKDGTTEARLAYQVGGTNLGNIGFLYGYQNLSNPSAITHVVIEVLGGFEGEIQIGDFSVDNPA